MRNVLPIIGMISLVACLTMAWMNAVADEPNVAATSWGSDHVGKPVPEYVTGDECLFCHRTRIAESWPRNPHQITIRAVDSDPNWKERAAKLPKPTAGEVELLLGRNHGRCLKRSTEYGKLSILDEATGKWDDKLFAQECAGCHTTAVDPQTQAFSAISLDCVTCHGVVDLKHSKNTKLVLLAKSRHDEPRVVAAICGQCHLRGGKSQSTGRPYPNNFIAGDNLFRDFHADFSDNAIAALDPGERHVRENLRDMLRGNSTMTCISCHDVHRVSSAKHQSQPKGQLCAACHPGGDVTRPPAAVTRHNKICRY